MKKLIPIVVAIVCITAVLLADEPQQRRIRIDVIEEQEEIFGFFPAGQPVPQHGQRHGWHERNSVMTHLFAGQRIELDRALSGGFNVIILDEGLKERDFEDAGYEPPTILHAGPNSIVVVDEKGVEQTIASHAIHVVTRHPDAEKGGVNRRPASIERSRAVSGGFLPRHLCQAELLS